METVGVGMHGDEVISRDCLKAGGAPGPRSTPTVSGFSDQITIHLPQPPILAKSQKDVLLPTHVDGSV